MPKYPNITINLSGFENDNFVIIIKCLRTLRENNIGNDLDNFVNDLKNGGNNLIATVEKWFSVK